MHNFRIVSSGSCGDFTQPSICLLSALYLPTWYETSIWLDISFLMVVRRRWWHPCCSEGQFPLATSRREVSLPNLANDKPHCMRSVSLLFYQTSILAYKTDSSDITEPGSVVHTENFLLQPCSFPLAIMTRWCTAKRGKEDGHMSDKLWSATHGRPDRRPRKNRENHRSAKFWLLCKGKVSSLHSYDMTYEPACVNVQLDQITQPTPFS